MKLKQLLLVTALLGWAAIGAPAFGATPDSAKHTFSIGENDFLLDGQRLQIRCGEIHAPRIPREYWRHRLQMCKAMGLNTVCAYLFWNMHEPKPGHFDWSGQADAAEFCRIAQQEGLLVLLRPGPYSCAEWEMGGMPWWLLKEQDIRVRTSDPHYLEAAKRYLKEVGRVLGPLQVTKGGPILMVQVENEYGSFGKDAAYMGEIRQALIDAGFDVPLFACNPPKDLKNGLRSDLFQVVNLGSDPAHGFKALREVLPKGPLMCGEFYPGWFDTWGAPHHTGNTPRYLTDLEYMLRTDASFSIYMVHGGTTFGFWSGADRPFKPDTSSYDYDAPISEAGWATEKFFQTRALFARYLLPGETIPEPPAKNPVITIPPVGVTACAPLFENLPKGVSESQPRAMEQYDQGYGCILYRTTLPAGPEAMLEAQAVHDIGQVFLDGKRVGYLDRRSRKYSIRLPRRAAPATLDVLVDAMGRINFGPELHDHKGLQAPVKLRPTGGEAAELTGWQIFPLPLDDAMRQGLRFGSSKTNAPGFWRATLSVDQPGDTFLDLRGWGKGYVWVNGHNLGRYWNIGPTQTMYLPAPWLRKGENEIVILDLFGPRQPIIAGLDKPILDQLRPELDFGRAQRPHVTLQLDSAKPVLTGSFAPGAAMQVIKFDHPATGRYFCLETLNAHDGKPFGAMAELELLDASGNPISHDGWVVAYVDSEERDREDGSAQNAIDGQTASFWHTQWGAASPNHPHQFVLDLGPSSVISGFRYVPRQGSGNVGGRIKDYRIYVGDALVRKQP